MNVQRRGLIQYWAPHVPASSVSRRTCPSAQQRDSFERVKMLLAAVAAVACACAHSEAAAPPAAAAAAEPAQLSCGPIACPAWLSRDIAQTPLSLRERCGLLSKVLMFQPLTLAGRPLSAFESSQHSGTGRVGQSLAVAVSVREPEQQLERSLFAAGETCGARLLVLAPSAMQGDAEDADTVFRLSLTPETPGSYGAFGFALSAEALKPGAATAAWQTLTGRVVRGGASAGADTWTVVVHATVDSADALKD
jgi:hypothetical protein